MAQNTTNEYRKFRYYEGVCSSSDFIKELAQVVSLGVKSDAIKDANGKIIQEAKPLIEKSWDIVYPMVDKSFSEYSRLNSREKYLDPSNGVDTLGESQRIAKLKNQIAQITDTVVLRTKTTPKTIEDEEKDDLSVSGDTDLASTTMYVQFYKPKYLANPEEYPLDAELHGIIPQLITKEMYQEATKSKANAVYDLTILSDEDKCIPDNIGIVTVEPQEEQIDSVSNAVTLSYLFDENTGVLNGLANIFGKTSSQIEEVILIPTTNNRTTWCYLEKAHLNSIKQIEPELYNFIFNICGLKTNFTVTDYDLIQKMKLSITLSGSTEAEQVCYVHLFYNKTVQIYTVHKGTLDIYNQYGFEGIDNLKPELYAEGRYMPIPTSNLGQLDTKTVVFDEEIKFCLDKVVDDDVLYGTLVLRYSYNKSDVSTDLNSLDITESITLPNNHYCLVRMFDNPSEDFSGPEPNITDSNGNVTVTNSHTSPWSKLSWYQDFEEVMMDEIDEDISITNITDGTLLVPLETAGLTADTRISYWINTNNNRFSLIVMGNPALDYQRDRHLISNCYIGQIESFENSINDVSGNFALYTSSSTTPCKTTMDTNDTQYHINRKFDNEFFTVGTTHKLRDVDEDMFPTAVDRETNVIAYKDHCTSIGGEQPWSKISSLGFAVFYLNITGNKFFNEDECPRYMVVNTANNVPVQLGNDIDGTPLFYRPVANYMPIFGANDSRTNEMAVYINPLSISGDNYKVYFNFGYHEEKFVITSGITRDVFGNVIGIETIDDYGKNTADGVTSVSMYHTRSKAFYQKHHFLFATTEEYMSKVLYGKSSYTGEYYADRIKITHGNDGPRGILSDILVIDNSSLYPKDELVINKDFEKAPEDLEETFTYFPVTAPFSPLSDGPNARYGVALKKSEREPIYTDNHKILEIASNELRTIMINDLIIENGSTVLPQQTSNGCTIFWSVDPEQNWMESETGSVITKVFADQQERSFKGYHYEANNVEILVDGYAESEGDVLIHKGILVVDKGNKKTIDFLSNIKVSQSEEQANAFNLPEDVDNVLYGYSNVPLAEAIHAETILTKIFDDGTDSDNIHEYSFDKMFVDLNHEIALSDITQSNNLKQNWYQDIFNADPSKYLNIIFTKNSGESIAMKKEDGENVKQIFNKEIVAYASIALAKEEHTFTKENSYFSLLQYPCNVSVYIIGITNASEQGILYNYNLYSNYVYTYLPYNDSLTIQLKNVDGDVSVLVSNYPSADGVDFTITNNNITIPSEKLIDDLFINVNREE